MTDHTKALADALERTERQLRHLIEEVTHRPNPTNPDEVRIRPGMGLVFSNMVNASAVDAEQAREALTAYRAAQAQQAPDNNSPGKTGCFPAAEKTNPPLTVGDERGLALWQLIYGAIAHEPLPLKVGQIERAAKRVEDMLKRRAAAQAEPVAVKALGAEIAHEHDEALAELAAKAEAQFQADIQDAARYRVLRDKQYSFGPRITDPANVWLTYTPEGLDQACDEMLTFEAGSNPPAQGQEAP